MDDTHYIVVSMVFPEVL